MYTYTHVIHVCKYACANMHKGTYTHTNTAVSCEIAIGSDAACGLLGGYPVHTGLPDALWPRQPLCFQPH